MLAVTGVRTTLEGEVRWPSDELRLPEVRPWGDHGGKGLVINGRHCLYSETTGCEWEMSSVCSYVCTLDSQLVAMFGGSYGILKGWGLAERSIALSVGFEVV